MAAATPRAPTSLTQWNSAQQENAEQVDVGRLVASLQNALRQRGLVAWVQLGQSLEKAQLGESGGIGRATLKRVLTENQLNVTEVDARALLRCLGSADEGRTTVEAVKNLLCGPLTDRRLELVESVFEQLDRKRVGYVATQDVVASHDASKHPSVMFGEKTPAQVHDEFLTSFTLLTRSSTSAAAAFVNQYQWMSYFQYVSGHVPSEEYFELVMKRVWKATPRTSLSEATSKGIVSPTNSGAAVAPMSLLQALHDPKFAGLSVNTSLPPPAPVTPNSTLPQRLHRSNSLNAATPGMFSPDGPSPKATHTNAEFLKGTQFAACMVDPSLHAPTPSPRGNLRTSPRVSGSAAAVPTVESLDPGTLSVLTRLRNAIKTRGLASLVALTRQIRLGDANGDGLLSLAEFKQAIQRTEETARLQLSESDLRVLFKYLDRDHRGAIPVGVALDFIREPLNARRLALVQFAFTTLKEATGAIGDALEPSDVVQKYDAARHPDVIAGRSAEEQVFQAFIENFDLEDANDGKVSRTQWENYYHNVGFFVGDDDYFELLVRNTWQLAAVPAFATATPSSVGPVAPVDKRAFRGFTTGHNSRQTFAVLQPELSDHHASVLACERHGLPHASAPTFTAAPYAQAAATQSKELRRILHQLRASLKEQGVVGFLSLQRKFRLMDDDQNGSVSLEEFARALRESKVLTLSTQDIQNLFHYFDANHDGAIDCDEFMRGVREPMNEKRLLFVRMAFDLLDKDRNGVLEVSDIVDVYDARRHPEVLSGRKTQEDVFREFLESFDDGSHHLREGKVTFDEWTKYYENISASIDDDDYFELMMRNAWHISGGSGWSANSANRRLLVTHADGSASVEEVQNDLGVSAVDAPRVLAMQLASRGTGNSPFQKTSFYDVLDHTSKAATPQTSGGIGMVRTKNNSSSSMSACLGSSEETRPTTASATTTPPGPQPVQRRRGSLPPPLVSSSPSSTVTAAPAGVQAIIARLKAALQAKGAHGFCGLSRAFRLMDEDGNGALSLGEFRQVLRACALEVHDSDARLLFQYFDRDRSGAIDLSEFLYGVRDPMNERRLGFVREAFKRMDKDGNGLLEPSDIVETYDASKHPDVLSGRKTPDDVFREFLETFDVDGVHDGKITWDQWVHYYHNVSASVDDDDYFELMMRNAWHISGGAGWCANSTTRRVLVTMEDGREVVKEVMDDLGVKVQDVQARLQAQDAGQNLRSIATTSAMDLTQPPVASAPARKIVSLKDASFSAPLRSLSSPAEPQQQQQATAPSTGTLTGDAVFFSVRRRLQQKTLADVVTLRKRVLHYIDAKTGTVSAAHCAEALGGTLGLALSESHCVALFAFLNTQPQLDDGNTSSGNNASIGARLLQTQTQHNRMAVKKLLAGVLGSLSSSNQESVRRVFGALQSAGKGRVFPHALARSFVAANHPDVKLGLVTSDAVFQDFAASFEVSGAADGAIGLDQFEAFCLNWRATLTCDDHLDVLLRDCFCVAE